MGERKCIGLAVDAILYYVEGKEKGVLLVKRKKEPFKDFYALPGGFVEYGESVEQAVRREVKEEVGLDVEFTFEDQFFTFSNPKRDPRGHVVSVVFKKQLKKQQLLDAVTRRKVDKEEIKELALFPLNSLPKKVGFDHKDILCLFSLKI